MGLCSDPPPPPDLSGYTEALELYTNNMRSIANDQLNLSRQQFNSNKALLNRVLDTQLPIMEQNAADAREDREFYERTFRPIEEQFTEEARTFDTPERREQAAGEAVADVSTAFEAERENAARRLEGFGIDPSQTRSQAIDAEIRIREAAESAGAANRARRRVEDTGRALRGEAINIGKGFAGNVAGASATALNAGNAAVGNTNQTTATGLGGVNSAIQNYNQVRSGIMGGADIVNSAFRNELEAFNSGNMLTTALAGGAAGGLASKINTGGEIIGPGGPMSDSVPAAIATPQGGAPAALSNGEYIIPADVVKWKGLEFFEKQIQNSKKAISERTVVTPDGQTGVIPPPTVDIDRSRAPVTLPAPALPRPNPILPPPKNLSGGN